MKLPPKPNKTDPAWMKKEKWRKRKEAMEEQRISSDHELSGVRHRQPHRDKDIPLNWKYEDGIYHVTPSRVQTGGGLRISQKDWDEIWRDKTKPSSTGSEQKDKPQSLERPKTNTECDDVSPRARQKKSQKIKNC